MNIDKILQDDKWIFVVYVPGSFGSFISRVIETSHDVFSKSPDIFNKRGASHLNLSLYIEKFHNLNNIRQWANLNEKERIHYILDNITPLYYQTKLHKVHRLTSPKLHSLFLNTFPNAKFIKVIYNPKHEHVVIDNMCRKTYPTTLKEVIQESNPALYKVLINSSTANQRKWYYKECIKQIDSAGANSEPSERTFLFDLEHLFSKKHKDAFNQTFNFLKITPGAYDEIYKKFMTIHSHIKM